MKRELSVDSKAQQHAVDILYQDFHMKGSCQIKQIPLYRGYKSKNKQASPQRFLIVENHQWLQRPQRQPHPRSSILAILNIVVVVIIFFRFAQYPPPSLLRSDFNYLLFRSRRCFPGNKNIIMLFNSASIKRESFCKITPEKREQKMFLPDVNKLRIASSAPQELWERCLVQCSCQKSISVQHIFYEIRKISRGCYS